MKYLIIILFVLSSQAYADKIYNDYRPSYGPAPSISISPDSDIARAIAATQIHFDWSTDKWQTGAGVGFHGTDTGYAFGFAKKIEGILFNVNLQTSGEEINSGGFGATWRH